MSEAAPISRDEEMLGRLAELDLAAAEKAHARMMAAEEASEIAELGRTYQRMARSLRQTLALKAKMSREAVQDARWLKAHTPPPAFDVRGRQVDDRMDELLDAVGRVICASTPEREQAEVYDRFDRELDDWMEEDDFTTADLDALVLRAAEALDLPPNLARTWRDLPEATAWPDPAEADDQDPPADPPRLRHDSG